MSERLIEEQKFGMGKRVGRELKNDVDNDGGDEQLDSMNTNNGNEAER